MHDSPADAGSWARELRKGAARLGLVLMLKDGQSYGYEIVRRLKEEGTLRQGATESTIYPLLHDLESNGFLESVWRPGNDGLPARKYYALTSKGDRYAEALVAEWHAFRTEMDRLVGGERRGP